VRSELNWLTAGSTEGSFEKCNEPLGSTRGGKFYDKLSDYHFLKEDLLHGAVSNMFIYLNPRSIKGNSKVVPGA
jgi:hypothetical protein